MKLAEYYLVNKLNCTDEIWTIKLRLKLVLISKLENDAELIE